MSKIVSKIVKSCLNLDINVKRFLMGREFFTVETIRHLQESVVVYVIPCRNTGRVIEALRDSERNPARPCVTDVELSGQGMDIVFTMVVANRRSCKYQDPTLAVHPRRSGLP